MEDITLNEFPAIILEILKSVKRIEEKLQTYQATQDDDDDILNIKDAAAFLNITVPALYTKVSRREIPVCKPGKRLYFSKALLRKWILDSAIKTYAQLDQESNYIRKNSKK